MMRAALIMTLTLGLVSGAWAGPADEAGLAPAFGNTIVSTHPDGRQARLWLRGDHTFEAQGRAGNRSSGTWRVRAGKLCLTQKRPVAIPFSYCHAFPRVSVGASWRDTASNGNSVVNRIVRGR